MREMSKAVIARALYRKTVKFQGKGKKGEPMEAVFLLVTAGEEISDCCTKAFASGNYVRGLRKLDMNE